MALMSAVRPSHSRSSRAACSRSRSSTLSVLARRGLRRSAAGWGRPVDAPGAGASRGRRHADGEGREWPGKSRAMRPFRTIAQKGRVARPELGHSVHVEATGLQPGRQYFYRFRGGNEVSHIRADVTAPPAGAAVDRLRFGVCGCSHYELGYFTASGRRRGATRFRLPHRRLHLRGSRQRRPKPGACDGTTATKSTPSWTTATATPSTSSIPTAGRDPSAPFIVTWDDHEVDNDHAGEPDETEHAAGDLPPPPRRRVSGLLRNDAAARSTMPPGHCGCTAACGSGP